MYYRSKSELKRELGGQPFFSKLPSTAAVLHYQQGVRDYESNHSGRESEKTFGLQQYRKGFAFKDSSGKHFIGFHFEDVVFVNLSPKGERYDLVVKTRFSKPVHFAFNKSDRGKIIPFFRTLPVREEDLDSRNEESIREEILQLRDEFAAERYSTEVYAKTFQKSEFTRLEINKDRVRWGKTDIPMKDITGFSMGITHYSSHGIDKYDYDINLHRADKPFFIRFSSTGMFAKTGEFEKDMQEIRPVLFDLISRPMVVSWLEKFANNEQIDYTEFTVSRKGVLLKTRKPNVMIYWDELVANDHSVFRWRYTNTLFFVLPGNGDRRSNMFFYFINWLHSEEGRSEKLVGSMH